jgi:hypothetical protein
MLLLIFVKTIREMAKAFRPTVMVDVDRNYRGEYENNVSGNAIHLQFANYEMVKRGMKKLLNESNNNLVRVNRHRRGEWGEWFEHWSNVNGKPKIVKQGWM